jgi:uncharacterized membrane protein
VAVLLCTSAASQAFAAASLTPLGDVPGGGFFSEAWGVSDDGSTTIGYSFSDPGPQAFRHTGVGGKVGLGHLGRRPDDEGDFESTAFDVSGDGSVVIDFSTSASGNRHTARSRP